MCGFTEAMMAASLITGVMGANQAADARAEAYERQAAIDRNNAELEEWKAEDAQRRGDQEQLKKGRQVALMKGAQRAGLGASGLRLDSASFVDVQTDTEMFGYLDQKTIRENADRESFTHRANAANYLNSAGSNEISADNARTDGNYQMASTVLGADYSSMGFGGGTDVSKVPFAKTSRKSSYYRLGGN